MKHDLYPTTIRLTEKMDRDLDLLSRDTGNPRSAIIRAALRAYITEHGDLLDSLRAEAAQCRTQSGNR